MKFSLNRESLLKPLLLVSGAVERKSTLNFFEETNLQRLGRYVVLSYTFKLNARNRKSKSMKKKK